MLERHVVREAWRPSAVHRSYCLRTGIARAAAAARSAAASCALGRGGSALGSSRGVGRLVGLGRSRSSSRSWRSSSHWGSQSSCAAEAFGSRWRFRGAAGAERRARRPSPEPSARRRVSGRRRACARRRASGLPSTGAFADCAGTPAPSPSPKQTVASAPDGMLVEHDEVQERTRTSRLSCRRQYFVIF